MSAERCEAIEFAAIRVGDTIREVYSDGEYTLLVTEISDSFLRGEFVAGTGEYDDPPGTPGWIDSDPYERDALLIVRSAEVTP